MRIGLPVRRVLALAALVGAVLAPLNANAAFGPECLGLTATIVGTNGDDVIDGTPGDDVIVGLGGDDLIRGGEGDDVICGGGGDDEILGGAGNDRIAGGRGNDTAFGGTGIDDCRAENATSCEVTLLTPGATGPAVRALQSLLKEKALYLGPVDGTYGKSTGSAVVAFHKISERNRTDRFLRSDWRRLLAFDPEPPIARSGEPDRIEIDITHQVLYLIEGNEVAAIVPVSTGGGYRYYSQHQQMWRTAETPRGDFTLRWKQTGWNTDSTTGWSVYNYWSFSTYYGIHGYLSVPVEPASHGCVRINIWDSDRLMTRFRLGMPVHIWDA